MKICVPHVILDAADKYDKYELISVISVAKWIFFIQYFSFHNK